MVHVLKKQEETENKAVVTAPEGMPVTATNETTEVRLLDPLDSFVASGDHLAASLWHSRHANDGVSIVVTDKDIQAFWDCMAYLKVTPQVIVHRPQGMPEIPGQPATATRSAVPGRPAEGPRNFVVIRLADLDGNPIVPVENNQEDYDKQQLVIKRKRAAEQIATMATGVRNAAAVGEFSQSDVIDLAEAALLLINK